MNLEHDSQRVGLRRAGWPQILMLLVTALAVAMALQGPVSGMEPVQYPRDVLPILSEHCFHCHGPDARSREAQLRLDLEETATRGDAPAIVRGNSGASELIRRINSSDPDEVMPPPKSKEALTLAQKELLRRWVDEGATWGKHWAFAPVKRPRVPPAGEGWAVNEIDRFLAEGHTKAGISTVGDASRRAWIRRATFDLTGLPPMASDIEAFVADQSDDPFAKVVERLLASKAYGERWGRHWLDIARYADTQGDSPDYPIPQAWRYRNWVIDAFNADMPYDQFLREQIAGDLLPARDEDDHHRKIIATGFIALSRRFGGGTKERITNLTIEDTLNTLGQATMGLTLSCARCHDHKFDPIPTREYYALYGIFESTRYPSTRPSMNTTVQLISQDALAKIIGDQAEPLAEIEARIAKLGSEFDQLVAKALPAMEKRKELEAAKKELAALKKDWPEIPDAYAVLDGDSHKNSRLQVRGEASQPGEEIPRGFLTVGGGQTLPHDTKGSGRLELANWIANQGNPLTTRVIVNRLWHHHFGRGLVATTNDFGSRGSLPSNPELLDWLADRLVAENWSLKQMHRLIMLSRAYRLAADELLGSSSRDPDNDLVWRFSRRRLSAEETRDAMMAVAGALNTAQPTGHSFPPLGDLTEHAPFRADLESNHRSVYVMQQRNRRHPYFELFDGANTAVCTGEREQSLTPLQALFQLNSEWVCGWSQAAAARVNLSSDGATQVNQLYRAVLSRDANPVEVAFSSEYLRQFAAAYKTDGREQALASLARALFASNEFMIVE